MDDIQHIDTPKLTVYTGYICFDEKDNCLMVIFPEFPEVVITFKNKQIDPFSIAEECTKRISEEVAYILSVNRTIPWPQNKLREEKTIDIYIDIEKIKENFNHLYTN